MRMGGEKKEPVSDGIDQPVSDLDIAAFLSGVEPDIVEVRFRLWRETVCHLTAASLGVGETGATALFYIRGEVFHGLFGDVAALTSCE